MKSLMLHNSFSPISPYPVIQQREEIISYPSAKSIKFPMEATFLIQFLSVFLHEAYMCEWTELECIVINSFRF